MAKVREGKGIPDAKLTFDKPTWLVSTKMLLSQGITTKYIPRDCNITQDAMSAPSTRAIWALAGILNVSHV